MENICFPFLEVIEKTLKDCGVQVFKKSNTVLEVKNGEIFIDIDDNTFKFRGKNKVVKEYIDFINKLD